MRIGRFAALTIVLAAIVGADAAQGAAPIACTDAALRGAVAAGGVIEIAGPCDLHLVTSLTIGAGANVDIRGI